MNHAEQRAIEATRNAAICAYYLAGHSARACGKKFLLSRARIYQIIKKAGILRNPVSQVQRNKFLGVSVSEQTKAALIEEAGKKGISVSRLTSDALDALVVKS